MSPEQLPKKFIDVLVLVKFDDLPPIAAVGFFADTADTHEPYFHLKLADVGYDISLIQKWVYLADVAPGFAFPLKGGADAGTPDPKSC